jgi:hypothetical protein
MESQSVFEVAEVCVTKRQVIIRRGFESLLRIRSCTLMRIHINLTNRYQLSKFDGV